MRTNFLILMLLLLVPLHAQEKVYTVDNLPKVHLANRMLYVTDPENIMSQDARNTIDRLLYDLEEKTGIETVVAVVPSIGDEDCFEFSHQLLNNWGVGKAGSDNGLVILLVTDQRCVQFYTGYGLEGDLPDAISKRIQVQQMVPALRNGDWNQGMVAGVQAVYDRLINTPEAGGSEESSGNLWRMILVMVGIVLFFIIIAAWNGWRANRCPRCGKNRWKRTQSKLISNKNGVKTEDVTYVCQNCGYVRTRREESYDENYRGGGGAGPFIGGMFGGGMLGGGRGGFGGGGMGGGSFGGGMGGGGGAGTRF